MIMELCKWGINLDCRLRGNDVFIWVAFLGLYRKVGYMYGRANISLV